MKIARNQLKTPGQIVGGGAHDSVARHSRLLKFKEVGPRT